MEFVFCRDQFFAKWLVVVDFIVVRYLDCVVFVGHRLVRY